MSKKAQAKEDNAELQQLNAQLEELTTALQRERADAMNMRRQHDLQMSGLRTAAKVSVVRELLPVIDNFELAIKHMPQDSDAADSKFAEWVDGVRKILSQFQKVLADMGVSRIKTVNEPFDPNLHEAISMEEGEGDQEIVSDELQAGYQMGDQVLRHAKVRVATR